MKTSKLVEVNILDIAVLLCNVFRAAQHKEIGYNDAEMSLESLKRATNFTRRLPVHVLEKLLYPSNMLDEEGEFWHYDGVSFDEFLKTFEDSYDKDYGWMK